MKSISMLIRVRMILTISIWVVSGFVDGISASTDFYPKNFDDF